MKIDEHFNLSMVKKRYVIFLIWLNNSIASNTTFQDIWKRNTESNTYDLCIFLTTFDLYPNCLQHSDFQHFPKNSFYDKICE